jgi:hypothetical protein
MGRFRIAFLAVGLAASSAALSAQVCAVPGGDPSFAGSAAVAEPAPAPSPTPVPEVPATPNQSAVDDYAGTYASSGTFDSDGTPSFYPADLSGSPELQSGDARAVVEYVYRHRLIDSSDTLDALMARDAEVAQAYSSLVSTGQLATPAETDAAAALHHLSLLRNAGSTGGFSVGGTEVVSTGVRPMPAPLTCFVNPGGFLYWANGTVPNVCMPNGREEAAVTLTVRQPSGQVYRAYTTSYACGPSNRSSYGFRYVPAGSAELIARPVRRCCQSAHITFQITCPPAPPILMACVPAGTNQLVNVTMPAWNPPGYWGSTTPGAQVWISTRDNACINSGQTTADASGNYIVRGCLPSEDIWVYAEKGNQIGRTNVPENLGCGVVPGPYNIALANRPKISGTILNWQPIWYPDAGAVATGCFSFGCTAGAALTVLGPGSQLTGSYQLELKPGHWSLGTYHDLGYCVNSSGRTVLHRCGRYYGEVDLEAGQQLTINLPAPPASCPCPQ